MGRIVDSGSPPFGPADTGCDHADPEQRDLVLGVVGSRRVWTAEHPHAEGEPGVDGHRPKAGPVPAVALWAGNAELLLGR